VLRLILAAQLTTMTALLLLPMLTTTMALPLLPMLVVALAFVLVLVRVLLPMLAVGLVPALVLVLVLARPQSVTAHPTGTSPSQMIVINARPRRLQLTPLLEAAKLRSLILGLIPVELLSLTLLQMPVKLTRLSHLVAHPTIASQHALAVPQTRARHSEQSESDLLCSSLSTCGATPRLLRKVE